MKNTIVPINYLTEEIKPLIWKGDVIPEYFISNTGNLYKNDTKLSKLIMNERNYASLIVNNKRCSYRLDYMVAYTFLGMRSDAIRLIHLDNNTLNDNLNNLVWYRKCDVIKEYQDLAIIEPDGSIIEQWKPCITEYNMNLGYEVSNLGMVRDKDHNLVQLYENHGYRVFYYLDEKFAKQTRVKSVHRAVAEAFLPNPNNYPLVNHLDGNKLNDVAFNLEWSNNGMNSEHAYLQNLNTHSIYSYYQIDTVCKLLAKNDITHVQIAHMTGVDRKTISDIYRGRRWADVSSKYKMPERKWTPELKAEICKLIIEGYKGKEIFNKLNMNYDQSSISFYERMRRELRAQGKI